jgi:hypothetical protein
MRFLTCEPNLDPLIPYERYVDEADWFYANPNQWFTLNRNEIEFTTTHLVIFENLFDKIKVDLELTALGRFLNRFDKCERFSYSFIEQSERVGKYILLCHVKSSHNVIDFEMEINSEF